VKAILREFIANVAMLLGSPRKSDLLFLAKEPRYAAHTIGNYSYGVNSPLVLTNTVGAKTGTLTIGKYCSIASGVTIMLGGEHRPDWVTTYPFSVIFKRFANIKGTPTTKGDVVIGSDVWIGQDVIILSGVTIGDGAVIGAGSVVTKDVEPYEMVAGNPARMIRKRFDDRTISKLLAIKWWNWKMKRISENMPFLLSSKIEEFIERNSD
jgi:acetyltransferase-like isoleucine patch superfamily enzyme